MALTIAPLTPEDAQTIAGWRYQGQYACYNPSGERDSDSISYMLDARNGFHAVRGAAGLVGLFRGRVLRVTIASWNHRALKAARHAGFRSVGEFRSTTGVELTVLVRGPGDYTPHP